MKKTRFWLIFCSIIFASIAGIAAQIYISLPKIEALEDYSPSESTVILAADDSTIARFHAEENRHVIPFEEISPNVINATIAIEDERFYSHNGIDLQGIVRAFGKNLLHGRIVEGGSTITQQLARNLYLTRRRNIIRKISEIVLALELERHYTKEEILDFYFNQIYFGHNTYGIESAATLYFNKKAKELDIAESAMIAGLIEGPEIFSPYKDFQHAKLRQKIVLNKMAELGMISKAEADEAFNEQLSLHPENVKKLGKIGHYFTSYVFQKLIDEYGEEAVNKAGLRVYTTLDPKMQIAAEEVASQFVQNEGPKYRFTQIALVAIDPRNGYIKAMVGGAEFSKSQFNRAVQAKRQPGSSFKPFVYAAAIEREISPGTVILDKPISFRSNGKRWSPKNFDRVFRGNVTMQMALERSLNIPAIKVLQKVGVYSAISLAKRLGIQSYLEPSLSLALGASEVTLFEMTSAFGAFANSGLKFEPIAIKKIVDRDGDIIFETEPSGHRVLANNVAAIIDHMMQGVILRGTGVMGNIGRPAAAKTGTSQDFRDAWFIGFVPQLVAGVWVGNDNNTPMKGVAEVAVCPRVWKGFMLRALAGQPVYPFKEPEGLTTVDICLESGLLANQYCPKNKVVPAKYFDKDIPQSECYIHPEEGTEETSTESIGEEVIDVPASGESNE